MKMEVIVNKAALLLPAERFSSQTHIAAEVFAMKAGISLNHIPFQGGGPADTALLGKHVDMCFGSVGRFGERVKPGGGLRLLAVTD